jgi:hypothetical protein
MRIRATAAATATLVGALGVTALAIPSAEAATPSGQGLHAPASDFVRHSGPANTAQQYSGISPDATSSTAGSLSGVTFSGLSINSGKPIRIGTYYSETIAFHYYVKGTASQLAGIYVGAALFRGDTDNPVNVIGGDSANYSFKEISSTEFEMFGSFVIDPRTNLKSALDSGNVWHTAMFGTTDPNSSTAPYVETDSSAPYMERLVALTEKASATTVKSGTNIDLTGQLNVANWATQSYTGYGPKTVTVQYQKPGSSTWQTWKTVSSTSTGSIATVVKPFTGKYRMYWAGNAAAEPQTSTPISITAG